MTQNGSMQPESLVGQTPSKNLGMVVSGSLTEGMEVRLDASTSIEDIKVGTFVSIQGQRMRFFGVVTEVALKAMDHTMVTSPPDVSNPFIAKVISGTAAYGTITVEPMLTIGGGGDIAGIDGPQPAKTVPPHFSAVGTATDDDIRIVFGEEDENHFYIGNPLDMETRLCLNIEELVKRSNGVFGKSGTGKTFLTRLLLLGILQNGTASNLVFDMHGEYGWKGTSESDNREVKGLKQLFPSKVAVFSLDEESSRRRGLSPDYIVRIGYEEIEPEDIQMLRDTLNLSEVAADAAHALQRKFGRRRWLKSFLDLPTGSDVGELAQELNVNERALSTLHSRLARLDRYHFMDKDSGHDSVNQILNYIERGMHVVLEFGRYGSDLTAYILVANLLTRRIHNQYVDRKEEAEGGQGREPRPLVIVIEEAHKFLSQSVASHTIFGTIARELRKYNVTLMVIDQRPSGIDSEVMSQVGTRLTCLLDNERDIEAVLEGTPGSRQLRTVLARLEPKQQALIFGHALPMPVVIHTREYGSTDSYEQLSRSAAGWTAPARGETIETHEERLDREISELFPEDG